ncbi:hypothetical protein SVIOM342S_05578 [Streptomyces violaceorubidus]
MPGSAARAAAAARVSGAPRPGDDQGDDDAMHDAASSSATIAYAAGARTDARSHARAARAAGRCETSRAGTSPPASHSSPKRTVSGNVRAEIDRRADAEQVAEVVQQALAEALEVCRAANAVPRRVSRRTAIRPAQPASSAASAMGRWRRPQEAPGDHQRTGQGDGQRHHGQPRVGGRQFARVARHLQRAADAGDDGLTMPGEGVVGQAPVAPGRPQPERGHGTHGDQPGQDRAQGLRPAGGGPSPAGSFREARPVRAARRHGGDGRHCGGCGLTVSRGTLPGTPADRAVRADGGGGIPVLLVDPERVGGARDRRR